MIHYDRISSKSWRSVKEKMLASNLLLNKWLTRWGMYNKLLKYAYDMPVRKKSSDLVKQIILNLSGTGFKPVYLFHKQKYRDPNRENWCCSSSKTFERPKCLYTKWTIIGISWRVFVCFRFCCRTPMWHDTQFHIQYIDLKVFQKKN